MDVAFLILDNIAAGDEVVEDVGGNFVVFRLLLHGCDLRLQLIKLGQFLLDGQLFKGSGFFFGFLLFDRSSTLDSTFQEII